MKLIMTLTLLFVAFRSIRGESLLGKASPAKDNSIEGKKEGIQGQRGFEGSCHGSKQCKVGFSCDDKEKKCYHFPRREGEPCLTSGKKHSRCHDGLTCVTGHCQTGSDQGREEPDNVMGTNLRGGVRTKPFRGECTAELSHIESVDGHSLELLCLTPDRVFPLPSVPSTWIHKKLAESQLRDGVTRMEFPSGAWLDDSGKRLLIDGLPTLINDPTSDFEKRRLGLRTGDGIMSTTGSKKVVIVRVIHPDGSEAADLETLGNLVFGRGVTAESQFYDCSHGQFEIEGYWGDGLTHPDESAIDITLPDNYPKAFDSLDIWYSMADEWLPRSLYDAVDHFLVFLPDDMYWAGGETIDGFARMDRKLSFYVPYGESTGATTVTVVMHEIGHQLGLMESEKKSRRGVWKDYADRTGYMGSGNQPNKRRCFNPAYSWYLGWYSNGHKTITKAELDDGALYLWVGSVHNTPVPAHLIRDRPDLYPTIIKLQTSDGLPDYFMYFNWVHGMTDGTGSAKNRVAITSKKGLDDTRFVKGLEVGQKKILENFDNAGKDLKIMCHVINPNLGRALVEIKWL